MNLIFIFICIISPLRASSFDLDERGGTNIIDSYSSYEIIDVQQVYERVDDYSISKSGNIAVATNSYINFYNKNGDFIRGIIIPTQSGAYAIDYADKTIEIFEIRTNRLIVINAENGNIIRAITIKKSNNYAEINRIESSFRPLSKTELEYTYTLNPTLSELTRVKNNEQPQTIYKMNSKIITQDYIYVSIIIIVSFSIIIYRFKSKKRNLD